MCAHKRTWPHLWRYSVTVQETYHKDVCSPKFICLPKERSSSICGGLNNGHPKIPSPDYLECECYLIWKKQSFQMWLNCGAPGDCPTCHRKCQKDPEKHNAEERAMWRLRQAGATSQVLAATSQGLWGGLLWGGLQTLGEAKNRFCPRAPRWSKTSPGFQFLASRDVREQMHHFKQNSYVNLWVCLFTQMPFQTSRKDRQGNKKN